MNQQLGTVAGRPIKAMRFGAVAVTNLLGRERIIFARKGLKSGRLVTNG
jgi:hypothetical protein